ncbi:putative NRPS-like enzyme [Xylaria arbuscula]|nr:putative NRPS-like enzyme [Xylaria arbuscula]
MTTTMDHERAARYQDDLIPHVVDRLARERADAGYAEWVTATGVETVNYAQLANMVNGLAWCIVDQLGGRGSYGPDAEVLSYFGPNDARYGALLLAAIKAGYVLFVTSPRNSIDAHRALFDHLHCRTLFTSDPVPPAGRQVIDAVKSLRHFTVPSVEELLTRQYEPFVLDKTFHDLKKTPFVVMHTSGTTGLPKPIIWTHETCAQVLASKSRDTNNGVAAVERYLQNGKRVIVTLPPFHGALLAQLMCGAIPYGNIVIAPVAAPIPTARVVVDAIKKAKADVAILVPSVVAELAQDAELLDYCATHLETIMYIGGDLPQAVGDHVTSKLYLRCLWGATEAGIVPQLLPQQLLPSEPSGRTLWRYVQFHPCVGAVFDEVTDGVYELVIRRDKALEGTQPCFTVPGIDQLDEYRTKDLFAPHPTIPDLWCWRARVDDIIVFLNGEKTNPISMEHHIMASNPELSGVLVIGAQRFQAALLVEPNSKTPLTTSEQAELVERIWPSVEDANRSAPAHARIEKSFILVLPADRPLIRSGKGTFMRNTSISQYTAEIEKLYADSNVTLEDYDGATPETAIHTMSLDDITRIVRHHVRAVTGWTSLEDADNFFDRGMDSLQGLQLIRALRSAFHQHDLALSSVYQNPTASQLASTMLSRNDQVHDERKNMQALFDTYNGLIHQIQIPESLAQAHKPASELVNVMFTGSTGTTGTDLLHVFLAHHRIGRIFCVNRGEDGGRAAQYGGFVKNGFSTAELDNRVTFIKGDLQNPLLGLDHDTYNSLSGQVGLIIHAAWPVNFNLALLSFRPQFAAMVNLLAFAAAASSKFIFISSVAAVSGNGSTPPLEEVLKDFDMPSPFGYGQAKFIAELLTDSAARHLKGAVPTTILRIGQVAGPVRHPGLWNPREWFPSMILSSLNMDQVPDDLGLFNSIDFVPVDMLANVMLELAMTTSETASDGATVFNIRNPNITLWQELLPAVTAAPPGAGKPPFEAVPPATWLVALRASADAEDDDVATKSPAVKLLGFFDQLWNTEPVARNAQVSSHRMDVQRALAASPSLRELEPVNIAWMKKWVEEWTTVQKTS